MPMLLMMVSMVVARTFGFRHREVEHDESVFRINDVVLGFVLWAGTVALVSVAFQAIVPTPPGWVSNLLGAVALGVILFAGTVWMPFVEHLSQLGPGEVTARQRRGIVILARAIPYLYGLVAILMALVLTVLIVAMIGALLVGSAQLMMDFDPASVDPITWRWLAGGAVFLVALFFVPNLLKQGRLQDDWGLPAWQGFVEPGQRVPAGEWLFRPLDATLGRLVLAATKPSATERATAVSAPTQLSDLRRFPGDIGDFAVAIVASGLVLWFLSTVGGAIIGWAAPDLVARINAALSSSPTVPGETAQVQPALFAVILFMIIPMVLTLFGTLAGLMWLATRSQNVTFSRQGWVRWLARGAELLRLLGLALMALMLGGLVGVFLGSVVAPDQPWVGIVIFAASALLLASAFLRAQPDEDGALISFAANVRAANQPKKTDASDAP